MLKTDAIEAITVEGIAKKYQLPHIGSDIVLMPSLRSLPTVIETRRMSLCLFIGICTSGVVALTVNDHKRAATADNVMVLTDESIINSLRYSDDFDGMGIFLSYKMLQEILCDVRNMSDLFLLTHNYPVFELRNSETEELKQYLLAVSNCIAKKEHPCQKEVARLTLLTMIYDMTPAIERTIHAPGKDDRQTRAEQIFVEFVQRVKTHFMHHRQVQWYAGEMGITPKYLSEVIGNVSRRSPNEWIDKFVTTEMRNQLRHTDKSISQIATELNFSSQSFFGKYFKENIGISPTEYRNGIEPRK